MHDSSELTALKSTPLKRLDHLICSVPDIESFMLALTHGLGFLTAWPIGRFWPQGRTSGVALGGINLELLQLDEGAPAEPEITTLVFEPADLRQAAEFYQSIGVAMELREKWESDPALLKLRGYSEEESQEPQLICRNLIPVGPQPINFFLCEYSPAMRKRLSPDNFPGVRRTTEVIVTTPGDVAEVERLIPLPPTASPRIRVVRMSGASRVIGLPGEDGDALTFEHL